MSQTSGTIRKNDEKGLWSQTECNTAKRNTGKSDKACRWIGFATVSMWRQERHLHNL